MIKKSLLTRLATLELKQRRRVGWEIVWISPNSDADETDRTADDPSHSDEYREWDETPGSDQS